MIVDDLARLALVDQLGLLAVEPGSRLTSNGGGLGPSTVASTVQYSSGTNALISASRSTTSRTATDCTRPPTARAGPWSTGSG